MGPKMEKHSLIEKGKLEKSLKFQASHLVSENLEKKYLQAEFRKTLRPYHR